MRPSLFISDEIRDELRSLPPELKKKVRLALNEMIMDPLCGKALIQDLSGMRSYKLGMIRIIYIYERKSIKIVAIGPRKTIYQKVALEVKRSR